MPSTNDNGIYEISEAAIAQRAYEIWESRGCPDGDGSENWEAAKEQLIAENQLAEAPTESGRGRGPLLRFFDRLRNRAA